MAAVFPWRTRTPVSGKIPPIPRPWPRPRIGDIPTRIIDPPRLILRHNGQGRHAGNAGKSSGEELMRQFRTVGRRHRRRAVDEYGRLRAGRRPTEQSERGDRRSDEPAGLRRDRSISRPPRRPPPRRRPKPTKNGWAHVRSRSSARPAISSISRRMDNCQYASIAISQHKARAAATLSAARPGVRGPLATARSARTCRTLDDVIASDGGIPLVVGGKIDRRDRLQRRHRRAGRTCLPGRRRRAEVTWRVVRHAALPGPNARQIFFSRPSDGRAT